MIGTRPSPTEALEQGTQLAGATNTEGASLLTVREVAALVRLTEAGVYSLVAQRRIPFIKISNRVRFERAEVVAWLERNRVPSRE